MANLTHRWTGTVALAANSETSFNTWYTDVQVVQAASFNARAVGITEIPANDTALEIVQDATDWNLSISPPTQWTLTIRSTGDSCDFIVSSIMVDQ